MKIYVDYRERELVEVLRERFGDIEEVNLKVGDLVLALDDHVVVLERKSAPDFIESLRSNRLWEQLLRMQSVDKIFGKEVRRRFLLLHGSISRLILHEFDEKLWASLSGAFMEVVYVYGIPIFFL
ncbi:MAG TPA: ERCC4-type nuclease, partial [Thermoplasmatales archaeon]|nr:ERCC4-type nuclease [Thermoplasmatales archaeon]HEX17314.1 ERCC4-type nuclease [Thermoplasmatales archaeon]